MSCDVGDVTERLENELCLFRFSYVTCSSLTSPGEPPMLSYVEHDYLLHSRRFKCIFSMYSPGPSQRLYIYYELSTNIAVFVTEQTLAR